MKTIQKQIPITITWMILLAEQLKYDYKVIASVTSFFIEFNWLMDSWYDIILEDAILVE